MRGTRRGIGALAAAVLVLVATACYPPSQTPTGQSIPPGGRVVATAATLKEMWIEDATPDLSEIVYGVSDFWAEVGQLGSPSQAVPYAFWVYNDATRQTVQVPRGHGDYGTVRLSPDGRSVVFTSNDPALQVGPTAINCWNGYGPITILTPVRCDELYLFDLDTGQTRQLTGLDGSSTVQNMSPNFSADGQSINFTTQANGTEGLGPFKYESLDLVTGQVTDTTAPAVAPTTWDRGTNHILWDGSNLSSTDTTTGDVKLLWSSGDVYDLAATIDNGHFIVLSDWVTPQKQVFELIDTDTGTAQPIPSQWISHDGSTYAAVQVNVAPEGIDRLVIAPVPPA